MTKQRDALDLVLKAVEFAAHKHKGQRRKDASASPYINLWRESCDRKVALTTRQ